MNAATPANDFSLIGYDASPNFQVLEANPEWQEENRLCKDQKNQRTIRKKTKMLMSKPTRRSTRLGSSVAHPHNSS